MQKSPTCPKCNVFYSTKDGRHQKQPLLLDCGHTFCEACLQKQSKENKTSISCSTCKVETSGDVKSLWPDIYTTGMLVSSQRLLLNQELSKITPSMIALGMRKRDTKSENLCRECCKRQANCRCEKCDFIMCMQCFDKIHSSSNMLKQHQAVPVTAEESDMDISPVCKEHDGRSIEYFCEDDNTPICSRCVIVGDHKKHSITSMEEKNKAVFADMEPALHTGNKVVKKLRRAEQMMSTLVPDMQSETSAVIEDIHSHFQELHGLLQAREKSLVQKVFDTYRAGIEPITCVKEQMQEDMRKLEISIKGNQAKEYLLKSRVKTAQRAMNNNNEVILHAKDILDELQRARDVPCIVQEKKLESTEKIRFEPDDTFMTSMFGYGNVTGTVSLRASWHTINEMPEELLTEDAESVGSMTPADTLSVVSTTDTAVSDDVIIEEEQEISLESGNERGDYLRNVKPKKKETMRVTPHLQPIPPKGRIKGGQDKVYVTHIRNPCHFMVQRCGDAPALKKLSRSINMWCRSGAAIKEQPFEVQKDDLLLGRYSCDREWYRVQVKSVIPGDNKNKVKLEVLYLDFGNSEVIGLDSVRKMEQKFMKQPPFVMECCLYDIVPIDKSGVWKVEAIQTFAKMTDGKPMIMIVMKEVNNVLHVDLSKPADEDIQDDRPISVRDSLVFLELANFITPASRNVTGLPAPKRKFMRPEPVAVGEAFEVVVTSCGDPSNFFVQRLGEEMDYFNRLMDQMQEQYNLEGNHVWSIYCPKIDMICVCKYSGDGMWYRAKVIGLPGHKLVEVQYVDFGNTEVVQHFTLRKILDVFIRLPVQATCCELSDVANTEPDGKYSKDANRWFAERVMMKQVLMKVDGIVNGKLMVTLHNVTDRESCSINKDMVNEGYAIGAKTLSGSYRHATSSEDSSGSYTSKSGRSTVPTGSSTSLSSVSSSRSTTPVPSIGDKSPSKQKTRNRHRESSDSSRSSSARKSEKPSKVKKAGLSVDIDKAQSAKKESEVVTPTSADPESATMVEVVISHFQSPSDFHVQLASSGQKELEELMEEVQTEYDVSEPQWVSWSEGKFCAAKYPEDGRWYRAKVLKVLHKNLIEVFMVDYGYYSQVGQTQLRPLQKQFLKQMCFAFRCHLADVVPAGDQTKWSITATEFMREEVKSNKMYIQKKGEAEHGSLPIDLLMEEHIAESALEPSSKNYYSLTGKLIDQGLGIPTKRRSPKSQDGEDKGKKSVVHRVYPSLEFLPPVYPPAGVVITVIPSYVDYDGIIYLQELIPGDHTLQKVTERIQEKFKHSGAHKENIPWKLGQACIAHFHLDGLWYRAKIIKLEPPHRVQVLFIDFGNSEVVTTDKLRADVEEFVDIPQQCYECELNNIEPISLDGKWSVPLLNKVHEMIVTTSCCAEIVGKNDDGHLLINLTMSDKRDFGTVLHEMGMVVKPNDISDLVLQSEKISKTLAKKKAYKEVTSLSVGQYFPVVVTHVELPNIVYFQHTRQSGSEMDEQTDEINAQLSQLEKMSYELNQIGPTAPPLPTPRQGLNCCAQFGYDKCWYRALVVENDQRSGQVLVLYVDYGTSEYVTLDRVRALPHQFMDLPAQAVRLTLSEVQSLSPDKKWTKDMLEAIIQSVGSKELIGCLKKCNPAKGDLFVVGESVGSELQLAYQPAIDRGLIKSPEESLLYNEALVGDARGNSDDDDDDDDDDDYDDDDVKMEEEDVNMEQEDVIVEEEVEIQIQEAMDISVTKATNAGTSETDENEDNICMNGASRLEKVTADAQVSSTVTEAVKSDTDDCEHETKETVQESSEGETVPDIISTNSAVADLPVE